MNTEGMASVLVSNPVNVAYLSGFSGTAGTLLITSDQCYLLTDFRYLEQARTQVKHFTVVDVGNSTWQRGAELLAEAGITTLTVESDHLTVEAYHKLEAAMENVNAKAIPSPVMALRKIKSDAEQQAIEAAVILTDQAFTHILPYIKPGVRERDIALELELFMRKNGASGVSFEIIAASGDRSAMPHGVAGDKLICAGDAVVLDFGCVLHGYCSDMTRTVFVGEVSDKQKHVYQAVLEAQTQALKQIRAGMSGREADALARDVLKSYGFESNFGHGLGHGLGREIHEAPRLSPAGDDILETGMVVTVEPGVYLNGEFGVRIEDVVVVGEEGVRILTRSAKDLLVI
jgi:Xaa-Pro aminopeptidase